MGVPYRAHLNERTLLNLPGFHSGAYVYVYVEDTSQRDLIRQSAHAGDADVVRRFLTGDHVYTLEGRANSLHKLDTLLAALQVFRLALEEEFEPYEKRQRLFDAQRAAAQRA